MNTMSNVFALCLMMIVSNQTFAMTDMQEESNNEKQAQKLMVDSAVQGGLAGSIGTIAGKIIAALCFPRHGSHLIAQLTNTGLGLTYYFTLQQSGSKVKFLPYIIGHLFGSATTTGLLHVGSGLEGIAKKILYKK